MSTEVRPIRDDELVAWVDAVSTGFLDRPNIQGVADEVRKHWDLARVYGAFEDGRIVGTFRAWAGRLTVPGCAELGAASVTGVSVLPTHRRRGILAQLAAAQHADARERGEPLAILFASEFPIYGRFGYGAATIGAAWNLRPRQSTFVAGGDDGRIEIVSPDVTSLATARDVYDTVRARRPGEVWRRPITWLDDFGLSNDVWGNRWKGFVAFRRDPDGTVDGYVRYHVEEKWEDRQPSNKLIVDDLHALTDDAELALWRFVGSFDWVATIRAERRTPNDRLPWLLTNQRAASPDDIGDGLWVKLLDVPRALESRRYEQTAAVVIESVDTDGTNADGDRVARRVRISLDASPDGARATVTDRSPDLTLRSDALGAAFLGGVRLSRAALIGGVEEHRPGALADADRLFATFDAPWCSSFF
ncbi:MAG TPA: GNAT family N-acetyltransferase [Candidatus Limnocylindrales bacterium]|nr:GNAT family N-acetyltransferase [Candidatus Limnocylindrales bacterium]